MKPRSIALAVLVLVSACAQARADDRHDASIVQIFASQRQPDYVQPWQMKEQKEVSGSGFVIAGDRILTNAHVVGDAMQVEVRKDGGDDRVPAHVIAIAQDCDLALLSVDGSDFFDGTEPVHFGGLPAPGTHVQAYGYTEGADTVSETDGVVSRIVDTEYAISQRRIAALQMDAALNPGNSGGPVFSGDHLVGMGFEFNAAERGVSYAIPIPIIQAFLVGVQKGSYGGVPLLGVTTTHVLNPAFRAWCGLPSGLNGDYVNVVNAGSSADRALYTGDVLLKVNERPIRGDGDVELEGGARVPFSLLIQELQVGNTVPVEVWRNHAVHQVNLTLRASRQLVPFELGRKPSYFIYGGLVFEPLTQNYIRHKIAARLAPHRLIHYVDLAVRGRTRPWRSQVVVLDSVLDDPVNKGYHDETDRVLERVNGHIIGDLGDLRDALEHPLNGFQVMEFDDVPYAPGKSESRVILRAADVQAANPRILRHFGIPADRSSDLAGGGPDSMLLKAADTTDAAEGDGLGN